MRRPSEIRLVLLGGGLAIGLGGCVPGPPPAGPACEKIWDEEAETGWRLECTPPAPGWAGYAVPGWYGGVWFGGGHWGGGSAFSHYYRGGGGGGFRGGGGHRGGFGGHAGGGGHGGG